MTTNTQSLSQEPRPAVTIDFPDKPAKGSNRPPSTLENFRHLLDAHGIIVRFNQVKKRPEITVPGLTVGAENRDAVTLAHLESLATRHGMSTAVVQNYILAVADAQRFDPFADWINSRPWDGTPRIQPLCATIKPREGYSLGFAATLTHKWLLSIVAATFHGPGFHSRGILTLQGGQGLGKTSWFGALVPEGPLRDECVKLGHSWDGGSKDSRLNALSHRIVELGELEGSFRRELESLKSFITDRSDKIRPPYGRVSCEYPRSTIFGASVNDETFLIDRTGNSRFWTIPVASLEYDHQIDMQQVFAELKVELEKGGQWWLTSEEEAKLATYNAAHEVSSVVAELITGSIDAERKDEPGLPRLRATEVLEQVGIERPSNAQLREANGALRSLLGPSRRIRGFNVWDVPWRPQSAMDPDLRY